MKRNDEIDIIKGMLIFCVIWGHTASRLMAGQMYNLDNWLNLFFISFHMPLFIGVSGYLFSKTLKKHCIGEIIRTRVNTILLPLLIWTGLYALPFAGNAFINGDYHAVCISVLKCWNIYWYLWSLFACSIIQLLLSVIVQEQHWCIAGVLVSILLLLLPEDPFYCAFMWPFFFLGLIAERRKWFEQNVENHHNYIYI